MSKIERQLFITVVAALGALNCAQAEDAKLDKQSQSAGDGAAERCHKDVPSGELKKVREFEVNAYRAIISNDGQMVAFAHEERRETGGTPVSMRVLSTTDGAEIRSVRMEGFLHIWPKKFSTDGKVIVYEVRDAEQGNTTRHLNLDTGDIHSEDLAEKTVLTATLPSPSGNLIAKVRRAKDGAIEVVDKEGKSIRAIGFDYALIFHSWTTEGRLLTGGHRFGPQQISLSKRFSSQDLEDDGETFASSAVEVWDPFISEKPLLCRAPLEYLEELRSAQDGTIYFLTRGKKWTVWRLKVN